MVKETTTMFMVAVISLAALFAAGCESDAQTGALIGSGVGAGVGALAGGDTESTLIGAGIGAAGGYMLGNEGDKKKAAADRDQIRSEMNIETIWITNSNGSRTPVTLRKSGPNYIGPNGEYYDHRPTEDELKVLYGT